MYAHVVHGLVFQHGYYDAQTPQLGQVYHPVFYIHIWFSREFGASEFVFVFKPVFEGAAAARENPNRKIMALSGKLLGG